MNGETQRLEDWPGARCNPDFCAITLERGGRNWRILIGHGDDYVAERALAAVCDRADIVIAGRYLPRSCRPRWFTADRRMLERTGGLAVNLEQGRVRSVSDGQGQHGWWNPASPQGPRQQPQPVVRGL